MPLLASSETYSVTTSFILNFLYLAILYSTVEVIGTVDTIVDPNVKTTIMAAPISPA
jgi:hypothetical protein